MLVNKYGRVAGSIDLATLAELYAQTDDDELRVHYRQVAAENGADFDETAEAQSEEQPEESVEEDVDALRAEAEALGVKVDGRWGYDRLRDEIDAAKEG